MSRQRTINDANFWRSPRVADCTQEDKATLLYLLTSPSSNVIGVYPIVPRIAAAEMGWTAEQLLPVLRRLSASALIAFDESSGYVWVKIWWDHNSPRLAVSTKFLNVTASQIEKIPGDWLGPYVESLMPCISPDLRVLLLEALSGRDVSTPQNFAKSPSEDDVSQKASPRYAAAQLSTTDSLSHRPDRVSTFKDTVPLAADTRSPEYEALSGSGCYMVKGSYKNNINGSSNASAHAVDKQGQGGRSDRETSIARQAIDAMVKSL